MSSNIKTAQKYITDAQSVLREAWEKLDIIKEYGNDTNLEDVCHQVLEMFTWATPSVGDVQRLKEILAKTLVSDFGVSASKLG